MTRFLILNTFYPRVLEEVYRDNPGLEERPYGEQVAAVFGTGFGGADFYSMNLRKLGHEAEEVLVNCAPAQSRWAREHGLKVGPRRDSLLGRVRRRGRRYEQAVRRRLGLGVSVGEDDWLAQVTEAQVEEFQPDVVLNPDLLQFPTNVIRRVRQQAKLLVGECAYPIPDHVDLSPYGLMVSCHPGFVARFRRAGIPSELVPHGFESSILERVGPPAAREGAVFIGSLSRAHGRRNELIGELARRVPIELWVAGEQHLPQQQQFLASLHPPAWGYEMYRRLFRAEIGLNVHIDVAGNLAANMRLFEVTGLGALLVTDHKENLGEFFEVGRECVAYHTAQECAELVRYYLTNRADCAAIAQAGQARTLKDHTIYRRMQLFCSHVENTMGGVGHESAA